MQRIDRRAGLALALLALLVLWSAKDFPVVPGQKVGAGFLPTIVGVGLLLCGLALVWRSRGDRREAGLDDTGGSATAVGDAARASGAAAALPPAVDAAAVSASARRGRLASAAVVVGVTAAYLLLAERLGFLLVAPVLLFATFKAMQVSTRAALLWSVVGALVVHVAFYKLLRVPLPWGVLRPFY